MHIGLDIGYSNLKLVTGAPTDTPHCRVMPGGAGPVTHLPHTLGRTSPNHVEVLVDGVPWAAAVEHSVLEEWDRELHKDFPASASYQALFLASLVLAEAPVVENLVTGLPVSQYADTSYREALANRLVGEHKVTPKRSVTVRNVRVLPQPFGAYLAHLDECDDLEALQESRVVVIDPGFYSVDWVAIEDNSVRASTSGTSTQAMSRLLDEAAQLIRRDYGEKPAVGMLERALRSQRTTIRMFGEMLDIIPYMQAAQTVVAEQALRALQQSLRLDERPVDMIVLTGGGAAYYADAAREVFPRATVAQAAGDAVLANAKGFWLAANS